MIDEQVYRDQLNQIYETDPNRDEEVNKTLAFAQQTIQQVLDQVQPLNWVLQVVSGATEINDGFPIDLSAYDLNGINFNDFLIETTAASLVVRLLGTCFVTQYGRYPDQGLCYITYMEATDPLPDMLEFEDQVSSLVAFTDFVRCNIENV